MISKQYRGLHTVSVADAGGSVKGVTSYSPLKGLKRIVPVLQYRFFCVWNLFKNDEKCFLFYLNGSFKYNLILNINIKV